MVEFVGFKLGLKLSWRDSESEWDSKVDGKKKMNNICHFPLIFILINPNGKFVNIGKWQTCKYFEIYIIRFDLVNNYV